MVLNSDPNNAKQYDITFSVKDPSKKYVWYQFRKIEGYLENHTARENGDYAFCISNK